MNSCRLVCRERSIVRGDGGGVVNRPRRDWKPVAASATRPRMSLVLQSFLPFPHSCQGPSPHQQGRDESARLIAEYVATMPTHVVRHDPAAARIAEIVTMRRQLCDEHVAIENQAAQLEDAMLRRLAKRRLARIETDIRLLEK